MIELFEGSVVVALDLGRGQTWFVAGTAALAVLLRVAFAVGATADACIGSDLLQGGLIVP